MIRLKISQEVKRWDRDILLATFRHSGAEGVIRPVEFR